MNYILKRIKSEKFPFFVLFIFMLFLHSFTKMQKGDDFWFQQVHNSYSIINYLTMRYFTWTGRMSSEISLYYVLQNGGFIWKIINPFFITLFVYSISRIVVGRSTEYNKKNCMLNWYICIGWMYISNSILLSSVFWMTCSIVYLWTMACALFAIIPFRDALKNEYNGKFNILYILCGIFAAVGQEQVSIVLVVFTLVININLYIKERKIYKNLIIITAFIIVSALVLFLAPGNYVRAHQEMNTYLPNYVLYSKWEVVFYGIQWILDILINNSKIIFLILISVLQIGLYKKKRDKEHIVIPLIGTVLLLIGAIFSLDKVLPKQILIHLKFPNLYYRVRDSLNWTLFDFNLPLNFHNIAIVKYIVWPVVIFSVPYLIFYLYDFSSESLYMNLIYFGGICSAIIMFISPTIYVSGLRTFFVFVIMLFIVFMFILKKSNLFLKKRYIAIFILLVLIKYLYFIFYFKRL